MSLIIVAAILRSAYLVHLSDISSNSFLNSGHYNRNRFFAIIVYFVEMCRFHTNFTQTSPHNWAPNKNLRNNAFSTLHPNNPSYHPYCLSCHFPHPFHIHYPIHPFGCFVSRPLSGLPFCSRITCRRRLNQQHGIPAVEQW